MEASRLNKSSTESSQHEQPSILGIMIDNCEDIKQSVSLIKREIEGPPLANGSRNDSLKEYDSLINILSDSKVTTMIKAVAGEDTHAIVNRALKDVEAGQSRQEILSTSLMRLKSNLAQAEKSNVRNDPAFSLAMGLVGLNKRSLQ